MNDSEFDTPEAREPPDYKVASLALWLAQGADFCRKIGVDYEIFERVRMICDEIYEAISTRGARVGEIVEAIREVRPRGSILADLPTVRAKLLTPREKSE